MANPNNLIRPPILNIPPQDPIPDPHNGQPTFNLENLRTVILEVIHSQVPRILEATLRPNINHVSMVDQVIDAEHLNNLGDLDKIPDVVKCLREFSGKPG